MLSVNTLKPRSEPLHVSEQASVCRTDYVRSQIKLLKNNRSGCRTSRRRQQQQCYSRGGAGTEARLGCYHSAPKRQGGAAAQ
ncbi:hypothetical protein AOLI_G00078470 [Acnodon oligacanthus]